MESGERFYATDTQGTVYSPPDADFLYAAIVVSGEGKVIFAQAVKDETEGEEALRQFRKAQVAELAHRTRASLGLENKESKERNA